MTEAIGARIREARLARGMSLRSVAQAVGVSASLISQVETGKTQPSVSTLYAIVNHLGISIDQLLDVVAPAQPARLTLSTDASVPSVQRADENTVLEMENGVRWERLSAGPGGPADALLVTYDPGAASSVEGELMQHAGVEYAYLLEGELVLQLEGDEHVVRPGDSLHFDSARPHQYVNRGTVPARGVWFVVGRRQQDASSPGTHSEGSLSSAVDVLRALDSL
jgi:transcriptional regulator with XRE-family HTH domain